MNDFTYDPVKWCILRTSGGKTLPLDRSLTETGIESWTPRETKRARLSRGRKMKVDRESPILPTFVFARAVHMQYLVEISLVSPSPHPAFSVFRHAGRFPMIDDDAIDILRAVESEMNGEVAKRTRFVPPIGSRVLISSGPFTGLTGIIEGADERSAEVNFGGRLVVKVASWILPEDIVQEPEPRRGASYQRHC